MYKINGIFRKNRNKAGAANERGFTLVELMIVVAIIATLAAIGIPQFLKRLDKGRSAETSSFFRHIMDQEKKFAALHNGDYYPTTPEAIVTEAQMIKALNLELDDAQNFCYAITFVDNDANQIIITATVRVNDAQCRTDETVDPAGWTAGRDAGAGKVKDLIVFQYPAPDTSTDALADAAAAAGWEGNVNMIDFLTGSDEPSTGAFN